MQCSHEGMVRFTEQLSNSYAVLRAVSCVGVAVCVWVARHGATGGVLVMSGDEETKKQSKMC